MEPLIGVAQLDWLVRDLVEVVTLDDDGEHVFFSNGHILLRLSKDQRPHNYDFTERRLHWNGENWYPNEMIALSQIRSLWGDDTLGAVAYPLEFERWFVRLATMMGEQRAVPLSAGGLVMVVDEKYYRFLRMAYRDVKYHMMGEHQDRLAVSAEINGKRQKVAVLMCCNPAGVQASVLTDTLADVGKKGAK